MQEEFLRKLIGISHEQTPCCVSCHEDMDSGYPASEIEIEGVAIRVCCAVARAWRKKVEEAKNTAG